MAEISKPFRIYLIITVIVALIYAILYLAIPEAYLSSIGWPYFDPFYSRYVGVISLTLVICLIIAIKRAELEKIQILIEFCVIYLILLIILIIWGLVAIPRQNVANTIINMVIYILLIIIATYFYIKEQE